jgi:type II secretory pathway pseudopilin PulG
LEKFKDSNRSGETGSTLVEVLISTLILVTGVVTMAQMFSISTKSNVSARRTTLTTVLAQQKLEQLRALTWGFDPAGLPVSDFGTDTSVDPETPTGGTGLQPSPSNTLQSNTSGYVDHLDANGQIVSNATQAPGTAVYTRRWSIEPLPTNPNNTLILQVLVTPNRVRGQAELGNVGRLSDEARVITVKTRKAQ